MKIVIKYGGSLLYDEHMKFNSNAVEKITEVVNQLYPEHKVCVVTGGGRLTRMYSNALSSLNMGELDMVAIGVTRLHSYIFSRYLAKSVPVRHISNYEELLGTWDSVITTGGFYPGQSTNGTAATCAELLGADLLVNFFNYDRVHSDDPESNTDVEPLSRVTYSRMRELIRKFHQAPGHYELFDTNALNTVERSKIPVIFLNGRNPSNILKHLKGEEVGTLMEGERK